MGFLSDENVVKLVNISKELVMEKHMVWKSITENIDRKHIIVTKQHSAKTVISELIDQKTI